MIGVIGGSGIYELFEDVKELDIETPFGHPSKGLSRGNISGVEVVFLPRHGKSHGFPPHRIPFKANVWALKHLGVKAIIAVSAVGSLKEHIKPGDIGIVTQYIDFTKNRERTFFNGEDWQLPNTLIDDLRKRGYHSAFIKNLTKKVVHVSMAYPYSKEINELLFNTSSTIIREKDLKKQVHKDITYITIEGPQFSTRAESFVFKQWADVIGMTGNPEVQLAREMEMCFSSMVMVTDYDCWKDSIVDVDTVRSIMTSNTQFIKEVLLKALPKINKVVENLNCKTLDNAVV